MEFLEIFPLAFRQEKQVEILTHNVIFMSTTRAWKRVFEIMKIHKMKLYDSFSEYISTV